MYSYIRIYCDIITNEIPFLSEHQVCVFEGFLVGFQVTIKTTTGDSVSFGLFDRNLTHCTPVKMWSAAGDGNFTVSIQ